MKCCTASVDLRGAQLVLQLQVWFQLSCETDVQCSNKVLLKNSLMELAVIDGRGSGHLGPAVGLKTLSIHVCVCPHFRM